MLFRYGLTGILLLVPILLISLTIHEMAHGYAALLMGDKTAKNMNRLSFNPIRHIDVIGFLMILTVGFGWAKPVPINMMNFKDPKRGMALTALAGPVSNILLAFLSALIYIFLGRKYGNGLNESVYLVLELFVNYNAMLAMFNLIPIPPLDGSKILLAFLPNSAYYKLMQYEQYGMIVLIILLSTNIMSPFLRTGIDNLIGVINSIVQLIPM